jgi:phosphatidate cytidylyltransferase
MLFGKHKLFERISPNKSWEGFIGGGIFSIIAAIVLSKFFDVLPVQHWVIIAIVVTIFGTFGDLVESMLKRQLKLKDIGNIMPGHGGLLDRHDSFLFVVPVVCLILQIIKLIQ